MTFPSWRSLLVALAVLALSGCGALSAQNPSGKYTPVNAVAEGDDSRVMLKGADVVAYFVDGKYAAGKAQFTSKHEAVTFRFASAEHKALFEAEPKKYLPQYGGYCANGIVYGIPWGGDADSWRIIEGKLYIFGGKGSRDGFYVDVPRNRALADKYWNEEVKGANAFIQRVKRYIFNRVPHYKSGEELADEVRRTGGGKS